MANSTNGPAWKLDTAASLFTTPVAILRMEWHPAVAGDDLLIKDAKGGIIWEQVAVAATPSGDVEWSPGKPMWFQGFNLVTIDGGALYVTAG